MGFLLTWNDINAAEEEHRIYRSTSPMDPQNLPAPVAALPADTTDWEDGTVTPGVTYYYRVGAVAYGGSVLEVSEELVVEAAEAAPVAADSFDHFDLSDTPDAYVAEVASFGAEVVAAIRDGSIAEDTAQVASLTDYGQHKWPQDLTGPVTRMWVLLRDNVSGDVLRVYAERNMGADTNGVLSETATWTFEALWQGQSYTGTGTWELSDNMGGQDFTSVVGLSSDDGSFAFKDGANTQGNQSRPSGDVFGAGNWNGTDADATMNVLGDDFSDFQGLVIFALLPSPEGVKDVVLTFEAQSAAASPVNQVDHAVGLSNPVTVFGETLDWSLSAASTTPDSAAYDVDPGYDIGWPADPVVGAEDYTIWTDGTALAFALSGLDDNGQYDLSFVGSRSSSGAIRDLTITIDGVTKSVDTRANSTETVDFTGVTPTGGVIEFEFSTQVDWGYLSAIYVRGPA